MFRRIVRGARRSPLVSRPKMTVFTWMDHLGVGPVNLRYFEISPRVRAETWRCNHAHIFSILKRQLRDTTSRRWWQHDTSEGCYGLWVPSCHQAWGKHGPLRALTSRHQTGWGEEKMDPAMWDAQCWNLGLKPREMPQKGSPNRGILRFQPLPWSWSFDVSRLVCQPGSGKSSFGNSWIIDLSFSPGVSKPYLWQPTKLRRDHVMREFREGVTKAAQRKSSGNQTVKHGWPANPL